MKKARIKELLCAISVIALVIAVALPVNSQNFLKEVDFGTTVSTHTTAMVAEEKRFNGNASTNSRAASVQQDVAYMSDEMLEVRFISMLNINNAFNSALFDGQTLAKCVAVSLSDYAQDMVGYGLCVNSCLVEGLAKSFYGTSLAEEDLKDFEAPIGYISLPQMGMDINSHTLVSMIATDEGYEVLTCMRSYDGGEEYATCLVKSLFAVNLESEFGFNLVSCETL